MWSWLSIFWLSLAQLCHLKSSSSYSSILNIIVNHNINFRWTYTFIYQFPLSKVGTFFSLCNFFWFYFVPLLLTPEVTWIHLCYPLHIYIQFNMFKAFSLSPPPSPLPKGNDQAQLKLLDELYQSHPIFCSIFMFQSKSYSRDFSRE